MLIVGTTDAGIRDIVGKAWALSLSSDSNILYSTAYDGRVFLWDTRSFKEIMEIETKGSFGMSIANVCSATFQLTPVWRRPVFRFRSSKRRHIRFQYGNEQNTLYIARYTALCSK